MKQDELQIIERLTGVSSARIKLANDGFWSRGYIIDGGKIVFKFKKAPEVSYRTEIKALEFVNSLALGVNLQKVGWAAPDDAYLGLYGIVGQSLETASHFDNQEVARQLATALRKLHQAQPSDVEVLTQDAEVAAWQKRYQKSHTALENCFTREEIARLDDFFLRTAPEKLAALGEKLVFSHGDLGDGNILLDDSGKVGIIDFSEMYYLDEAADFMDVSSDALRAAMLDAYGADEVLREKVRLRVLLRPLFVLGDYARRGDQEHLKKLVDRIRFLLEKEYDKI